ncbi:MAG: hypothetical protein K9J79_07585 [Desulfobacteraceae bacterium]|nr:hypothetical protein [Desulfobacteraceae bacterium]
MKISILGATGSVGTPTCFYLAASGLADELLLIGGRRQNVAEHYALDLKTAVSAKDVSIRHGGYQDLPGSDIVINVAGAHLPVAMDRELLLKKQTAAVKEIALKIRRYCPEAIIITGVNPVDSMNYATYLAGGFSRKQVIGYSINDTIRFRELLASELEVKPRQVDGLVIGEHGKTQVPLFSTVKVDGSPVSMTDEAKKRILSKIPQAIKKFEELEAGRTAGFTCAIGLAEITGAIIGDSERIIPCSGVLDGEYGQHNMSMGVPVVLGRNGIKEIMEYDLPPDEQNNLKITINKLTEEAKTVRQGAAVFE